MDGLFLMMNVIVVVVINCFDLVDGVLLCFG